MNIEEKINSEIKTAMLAKNAKKLDALRAIKSVILLLKSSSEGLTEESINTALQKEVKKRSHAPGNSKIIYILGDYIVLV